MNAQREYTAYRCPEDGLQQVQECLFLQMYACRSCWFSDKKWDSGHKQPSRALFSLFFQFFSVVPGGTLAGPAGPSTPRSVGKALQCVELIGVWRATSKTRQHDWPRRMVNFEYTSHYTSSSSSAHNSLSTHAMRKRKSPSYSSCSPPSICTHCMSWSKRCAEKVDSGQHLDKTGYS